MISSISDDRCLEFLYATLPFYLISFAGFINGIDKKKRKIVKTVVLGIISLILLRKVSGVAVRYVTFIYLIMSTIKILKSKKNRFKYLAIIWIIPIIIGCMDAYERIYYMSINSENQWMGMINGRNELINSAELFGTVNDPRKNSNDTTPAKFINSDYAFLSFLADYGWVASIAMTLAITLLCIKLIINSVKIKDEYGKMIIISIATIYILQTINNFKASFSIASFADVPIPFITFKIPYLFVNILCMALILSIYRGKNMANVIALGGGELET